MTRLEFYTKNFPRLVGFFELSPAERLAYTKGEVGKKWLSILDEYELDEVGELLCHATPTKQRQRNPIIGDLDHEGQDRFEDRLFGYEEELDEDME